MYKFTFDKTYTTGNLKGIKVKNVTVSYCSDPQLYIEGIEIINCTNGNTAIISNVKVEKI